MNDYILFIYSRKGKIFRIREHSFGKALKYL